MSDAHSSYQIHADVDKDLVTVMNRIGEKKHSIHPFFSGPLLLLTKLGEALGFSEAQPIARWSATALAGLLVAVIGFQLLYDQPSDDYSVLSSPGINDSSMRLSVEPSSSASAKQVRATINHELEKYGHEIELENDVDNIYVIVFKSSVDVGQLSKIVSDLENDAHIVRVEILH